MLRYNEQRRPGLNQAQTRPRRLRHQAPHRQIRVPSLFQPLWWLSRWVCKPIHLKLPRNAPWLPTVLNQTHPMGWSLALIQQPARFRRFWEIKRSSLEVLLPKVIVVRPGQRILPLDWLQTVCYQQQPQTYLPPLSQIRGRTCACAKCKERDYGNQRGDRPVKNPLLGTQFWVVLGVRCVGREIRRRAAVWYDSRRIFRVCAERTLVEGWVLICKLRFRNSVRLLLGVRSRR